MTVPQLPAATILIVDDQPDMVELMARRLQALSYDVLKAYDGPTAVRLASEALPQLVILDVMMPGMDGFSVCRELREAPATRTLPIIMLTARGDIDAKLRGMAAGASDFLDKAVDFRELVSRVKSFLDSHQRYQDRIEAEKLETLKQAATSLCHEINNPLAMISMKAELILMRIRQSSGDPEMIRGLELIIKQVERIGRITNRLAQAVRVASTKAFGETPMIDVERSALEDSEETPARAEAGAPGGSADEAAD